MRAFTRSTRAQRWTGAVTTVLVALPLLGAAPGAAESITLAAQLEALEVDTTLRGCDPIDEAGCLLPFPSNHLTILVEPDQIGGVDRGGTGRRVSFDVLGMPRNTAGKPIDPTEWNRNDGFSPGQMLMTYVPGDAGPSPWALHRRAAPVEPRAAGHVPRRSINPAHLHAAHVSRRGRPWVRRDLVRDPCS